MDFTLAMIESPTGRGAGSKRCIPAKKICRQQNELPQKRQGRVAELPAKQKSAISAISS
ncbi:MAG: hypothetical protein SFU86_19390 [Pirellulaceae bacterium]|nr:hypothetical protein [Pirellulaceae bacterium]